MTNWLLRIFGGLKVSSVKARQVLSMNQRNLWYVYPNNPRRFFPLADDKLQTKEVMEKAGVPFPKTHLAYRYFYELHHLERDLAPYREFVIKPSRGSAGGGIVVVVDRQDSHWTTISGKALGLQELRKHLADIIFGVHSFDLQDTAVVEERIRQHEKMNMLSPLGLADVRVILFRDRPVLAMTRVPTRKSGGRANLHQGAIGIGLDLDAGRTTHAVMEGKLIDRHPDTGVPLLGEVIPHWDEVLDIAGKAAAALPLKYLGVDISVSEAGPVLLEVNVRPGLEIQNANFAGLRPLLEAP